MLRRSRHFATLALLFTSCAYTAPTLTAPVVVTPEKAGRLLILLELGGDKATQDSHQVDAANAIEAQLRRAGFRITARQEDPWVAKATVTAGWDVRFDLQSRDRTLAKIHMSGDFEVRPDEAARNVRQVLERSEVLAAFIDESTSPGSARAAAARDPQPLPWLLPAKASGSLRRLAVLEFRGSLSPPLLALLADQARAAAVEAVRPHGVAVMTRENMMVMLKDQGRGATCTEGECEVESARAIGADLVVTGEISRVGSAHFLVLKLFDSTSGSLVASKHVKSADDFALVDAAKPAAAALFQ